MKVILQRVDTACVKVENKIVGEINRGFMLLLGVCDGDTKEDADVLANKIAGLRIFTDENDKMNLSLADIGGSVLVISNFTLCADCRKGRRPNFIAAAQPQVANDLYEYFCEKIHNLGVENIQKGIFGADMKVSLVNDGPVTIEINSKELLKK